VTNLKKLTAISTEADNARWSPDSRSIVFTSTVYPTVRRLLRAITRAISAMRSRRGASASKVKAQIFTHLLYRHWDHFTGEKRSHLFITSVDGGGIRDLTPTMRMMCRRFRWEAMEIRVRSRFEGIGVYGKPG